MPEQENCRNEEFILFIFNMPLVQVNTFKPLVDLMNMPEGQVVFGPLWRQITRYEEVGGLLLPLPFTRCLRLVRASSVIT